MTDKQVHHSILVMQQFEYTLDHLDVQQLSVPGKVFNFYHSDHSLDDSMPTRMTFIVTDDFRYMKDYKDQTPEDQTHLDNMMKCIKEKYPDDDFFFFAPFERPMPTEEELKEVEKEKANENIQ